MRKAGFVEIVGLPKLVKKPKRLFGVRDQIGWELQCYCAVDIVESQVTVEHDLVDNPLRWLPTKWNAEQLGLDAAGVIEPPH